MNVVQTALEGVLIIEPEMFRDKRGFFVESFHAQRYQSEVGIDLDFVQDNHSHSTKGILRGIHAQRDHPQGKLVRVVRGSVFDVAVDISPASLSFGRWTGTILTEENQCQVWIPPGFAHGFVVLSDVVDFEYKCTDYYYPDDECGLLWNDPDVAIDWPIADPILSDKDRKLPTLQVLAKRT